MEQRMSFKTLNQKEQSMTVNRNAFDFDEEEETKQFEKRVIFGVSPHDSDFTAALDFVKESMAIANMVDDEDDLSHIVASNREYVTESTTITGGNVKTPHANRSIPKYNSIDLMQSRGGQTVQSARGTTRTSSMASSEEWGNRVAQYSSIDDVVYNKPQVSASDYQKLQDELRKAKEMIKTLKYEKWDSLPVNETIKHIVVGKPYSLEGYKSLIQKKDILDAAIQSCDGNAITTALIFLEKTLKTKLFLRVLGKHSVASNHYIQHLRRNEEWTTLENLFKSLLLIEEAATLRYERINLQKDVTERVKELHKWIGDYGRKTEISELISYVQDEINLIEKQRLIKGEDEVKSAAATDTVMKYHPRPSIELKPLITTISYCALYHFNKESPYYPETFRKNFRLTDKQYEWAVIPPRANLHRWADIQELLTSKGWFKKGEYSHIGFENIATILYKAKANDQIMMKYLGLISNLDSRIKYASRFNIHDVVIEAIVQQRDRQKMETYRIKICGASKYRQKCNDLLHNTQIKWR